MFKGSSFSPFRSGVRVKLLAMRSRAGGGQAHRLRSRLTQMEFCAHLLKVRSKRFNLLLHLLDFAVLFEKLERTVCDFGDIKSGLGRPLIIPARKCDGKFVHNFTLRMHRAGISRF